MAFNHSAEWHKAEEYSDFLNFLELLPEIDLQELFNRFHAWEDSNYTIIPA